MLCEKSLNDIDIGQYAVIKAINSKTDIRRRFFDIGLTPETRVLCVGKSPSGDPKAFLIRGAVIAIRSEDLKDITIGEYGECEQYGSH